MNPREIKPNTCENYKEKSKKKKKKSRTVALQHLILNFMQIRV